MLEARAVPSESLMMLMVNYSPTAELTFSKANIYNAQNAHDATKGVFSKNEFIRFSAQWKIISQRNFTAKQKLCLLQLRFL